jgi:glucose-1-phosphatase
MNSVLRESHAARLCITLGVGHGRLCLGAKTAILGAMQPKFLYFDLGKVLVDFSVEKMLGQMAAVAGVTPERIREVIFSASLLHDHETGRVSSRQFHEAFCEATGTRPDFERLLTATTEIFTLNLPVLPIVAQLRQAGYPMGILSNTCEMHWEYCVRHYRILSEGFDVHALSYKIGAAKPDAAIFHAAAEMAGYRPEEIFFVDDIAGHIAGARAVGFDAVQFTTAEALARNLRERGIRFNY